jgi:DUF917 family protein
MRYLNGRMLSDLCVKSSWFGTGGGFPLPLQLRRMAELRDAVPLVSIEKISPESAVVSAYGVGSAAATDVDLIPAFKKALTLLSRECDVSVAGIFPAEIAIESSVCALALALELPLIDGDVVGGRAVPELRQDNCTLAGRSVAPVVACNANGEVLLLRTIESPEDAERRLRAFAERSPGGSVAAIDHCMTAREAKTILSTGTLSRSVEVGAMLNEGVALETILARLPCLARASLEVRRVELRSERGFFRGTVRCVDNAGGTCQIDVKNEYLRIQNSGGMNFSAPDLICLLDLERGYGIHSTELREHMHVQALVLRASERWRSADAIALFNSYD